LHNVCANQGKEQIQADEAPKEIKNQLQVKLRLRFENNLDNLTVFLNIEYRTGNVAVRSIFVFQHFDIHYSLFGFLRFNNVLMSYGISQSG